MTQKTFTIRVYGLLMNSKKEVLLVRELVNGLYITKFPGGGLEFGEGLTDCLRREFREELELEINIISHFYTTDFFVRSIFNPDSQVISVYYLVQSGISIEDMYRRKVNAESAEGELIFSWIPVAKINAELFTLPIDKHVAELYRKSFQNQR